MRHWREWQWRNIAGLAAMVAAMVAAVGLAAVRLVADGDWGAALILAGGALCGAAVAEGTR